jgi:hypothetical protein
MPKPMTWKEASKKLREMLDEFSENWSPQYKEAVLIGIERIEEVEDLQGMEEYDL